MNQFVKSTIDLADDLFSLFFPNLCLGCGQPLTRGEETICTLCHFHLPKTWFHNDPDNQLTRVFWGRVQLEAVASYLYFQKGGTVQHLLHQLKYKDRPEIGVRLGKWYGMELKQADVFRETELIIPVPLHPRKFRKRGYNQSEMFAEGLAGMMNLQAETRCLYRTFNSQTQTRKTRFDRWENVENIFAVNHPERLRGKHILLVDDVLTTGATLEACAQALLAVPGVRVSVVTIAYASI
jgi:ComF family protein